MNHTSNTGTALVERPGPVATPRDSGSDVTVAGQHPVLVIMGVSGSGKSTVAAHLAARLGWDVQEGDDLHPAVNIAKMAAGHPLTDDDRWPWLDRVAAWIDNHTQAGTPGSSPAQR